MMNRWLARELARRDSSLIGFWPFLGDLLDYSGRGNHAIGADGTPSAYLPKRYIGRSGFRFASNNPATPPPALSAGALASTCDFSGSTPFALTAWVCLTWPDLGSALLSKILGNNLGYDFVVDSQKLLLFVIGDNAGNYLSARSIRTLDLNTWCQVAVVYDGRRGTQSIRLFLNGVSLPASYTGTPLTGPTSSGYTLKFGNDIATGLNGNNSVLSLVRVYNRYLSDREILAIYRRECRVDTWREIATDNTDAALTLFLSGSDAASGDVPLYINGSASVPASGTIPLFLDAHDTHPNANITLFTWGYGADPSGGWFSSRLGDPQAMLGNFLLGGVNSQSPIASRMNLFTKGIPAGYNANMDAGYDPLFTLYERGSIGVGPLTASLFIGLTPTASITLFIQGDKTGDATNMTSLVVNGSSRSGDFSGFSLYNFSDASGMMVNEQMNLYICGPSSITTTRNMNLWVGGENQAAYASSPLTLWNNQSGVVANATLFVQGDGVTDGATQSVESMNTFLRRDPAEMVPLFITGPGSPLSQEQDLFLWGSDVPSGTITLVTPQVHGFLTQSSDLYTHGF